jgi:hypothetical protein
VLGNLTGLLARVKTTISATKFEGKKPSMNASYVDNLRRVGKKGSIKITGDVRSGNRRREFVS